MDGDEQQENLSVELVYTANLNFFLGNLSVTKLSLKTAQNRQKPANSRKLKSKLSYGWQRDLVEFPASLVGWANRLSRPPVSTAYVLLVFRLELAIAPGTSFRDNPRLLQLRFSRVHERKVRNLAGFSEKADPSLRSG
ncbi:MAG: hypothetical protein LAN71_08910 [Acidobacteriia bacterium]|nr:hypothetical protein [Terriglobia bacterium]